MLLDYSLKKCGKDGIFKDRTHKTINGRTTEVFNNDLAQTVILKPVTGVDVFDGTNTEDIPTHKIICHFIPDFVSTEKWFFYRNETYKVLRVENCCEEDNELKLLLNFRGTFTKEVNHG